MTKEEKELKKIQWTGDNLKEVIEFTGRSPKFDEWFKTWEEYEEYVHSHGNIFKIFFEDGSHYEVPVGSWIIKTPDGMNIPYTVTIGRLMKYEDENRLLLLKDLCARLPYQPICEFTDTEDDFCTATATLGYSLRDFIAGKVLIKPYLRPMSSMTEEERDEIEEISHGWFYVNEDGEMFPVGQLTDSAEFEDAILPTLEWLNKNGFDYRGLIPMGLALEAPEDMYKTE